MVILLLAIYLIFLLAFIIFSIIVIYHMRKFGFIEDISRWMIFIYIVLTLIIIVTSLFFIVNSGLGSNFEANSFLFGY